MLSNRAVIGPPMFNPAWANRFRDRFGGSLPGQTPIVNPRPMPIVPMPVTQPSVPAMPFNPGERAMPGLGLQRFGRGGVVHGGLPIGDVPDPIGGLPGIDYNVPPVGNPTVTVGNPFAGAVPGGYTSPADNFGGYGTIPVGGGDPHDISHTDPSLDPATGAPFRAGPAVAPESITTPNKHDPSMGLERADMANRLAELYSEYGVSTLPQLRGLRHSGTIAPGIIQAALAVPKVGGGRMPVSGMMRGGVVPGPNRINYDSVPTMLAPHEVVLNEAQQRRLSLSPTERMSLPPAIVSQLYRSRIKH